MTEDTKTFTHAGLDCKIIKTDMGHWSGYVRRPEDVEPTRWQSDYDSKHGEILDAEVDVFGGITYGPDDDGWVGFDDNHDVSLVENSESDTPKGAVRAETEQLAEQIAKPDPPVLKKSAEGNFRNGDPMDVYKCPFCQRRLMLHADTEHPDRCPWGCERNDE